MRDAKTGRARDRERERWRPHKQTRHIDHFENCRIISSHLLDRQRNPPSRMGANDDHQAQGSTRLLGATRNLVCLLWRKRVFGRRHLWPTTASGVPIGARAFQAENLIRFNALGPLLHGDPPALPRRPPAAGVTQFVHFPASPKCECATSTRAEVSKHHFLDFIGARNTCCRQRPLGAARVSPARAHQGCK